MVDLAEKSDQHAREIGKLRDALAMARGLLEQATKDAHYARTNARQMAAALSNIRSHATARVGTPGELGQLFFPALRDYCAEKLRVAGSVYRNTDGTSAASRWGIDFDRPPSEEPVKVSRRVTY